MCGYEVMKRIHSNVKELEGEVLWSFTQSNPSFTEQTGDGICLGLSCYYILCASRGLDLSTMIGGLSEGPGLKVTPVNTTHLGFIAQRQKEFETLKSSALKAWLKKSKLKEKGYCKPVNGHPLDAIKTNFGKVGNGYALVALLNGQVGGVVGHAVVVSPGATDGDARIFDPNFGEFRFATRDNLYSFIRYLFFTHYFSQSRLNQFEFKHLEYKA